MEDLNDKITGDTLTATEWNQVPSEIQNVIEGLGITLSSGDLNQLGKSIAGYVANGTFYTDSGAADAYVLSVIGSKQAPPAYTDGFAVSFIAGNDNTGASTINVAGLGVKNIKLADGSDPDAGDISGRTQCVYDSGNDWFELILPSTDVTEFLSIAGLEISNAADSDHDITIDAGAAVSKTKSGILSLPSSITKQIDVAWVAGDNAGGLFSGTVAADTTYHVFIIEKDSDGSIDAGFDTSLTASNIPSGYTNYRRVGSVFTNSSSNIVNFTQSGDYFEIKEFSRDVNDSTGGTAGVLAALPVPTGLSTIKANILFELIGNNSVSAWVQSPSATNTAPSVTKRNLVIASGDSLSATERLVPVDSSGQVRYRASATPSSGSVNIFTLGWFDGREE